MKMGDEFDKFLRDLFWESDRGCVLVGVSYVEEELRRLFEALFRSRSDITKRDLEWLMEGPKAPLLSGYLKAKIAQALGLISRDWFEVYSSLNALRIACAHRAETIEFTPDRQRQIEATFLAVNKLTNGLAEWVMKDSKEAQDLYLKAFHRPNLGNEIADPTGIWRFKIVTVITLLWAEIGRVISTIEPQKPTL